MVCLTAAFYSIDCYKKGVFVFVCLPLFLSSWTKSRKTALLVFTISKNPNSLFFFEQLLFEESDVPCSSIDQEMHPINKIGGSWSKTWHCCDISVGNPPHIIPLCNTRREKTVVCFLKTSKLWLHLLHREIHVRFWLSVTFFEHWLLE